ncbi:MAG: hypothetical protein JO338_01270 [Aquitalea sp.]|nr:hypothetical protein [Aquitalea sp.]
MLHLHLKEVIEDDLFDLLREEVTIHQDALIVFLKNGVDIELRFYDDHAYSINWRWGDASCRIDTAPLHRELATFPNHLHDDEGRLRADPVTRPGDSAWSNVQRLLQKLMQDPLLQVA